MTSVADGLKRALFEGGPAAAAIITSPQMTNEELYLVRKIFFEHLSIPSLHYALPIPTDATEDGFLLTKDRNPNTKGAELILV